jgi:hypothetical protein
MKRIASGAFALALVLGSTGAFAQGAAVEEPTEAETADQSSEWLVPTVVAVIVLCAFLCDSDDPVPTSPSLED